MFENFAHEIVEADVDVDRTASDGLAPAQRGRPEVRREAIRPAGRHRESPFDGGRDGRRREIRGPGGCRAFEPKTKERDHCTKPPSKNAHGSFPQLSCPPAADSFCTRS